MSIKSGLVFSKHTGTLVGFTDLTSVNSDFAKLVEGESTAGGCHLADKILVLMARAIFRPSVSYPVAHYPCSKLRLQVLSPCMGDS